MNRPKTASPDSDTPEGWQKLGNWVFNPETAYMLAFILGLVLLTIYSVYQEEYSSHHPLLVFVKELGFAYTIAAILGWSIERFNLFRHVLHENRLKNDLEKLTEKLLQLMGEANRKHSEAIAKDVIEAVYGTAIPKPILDALIIYILQAHKIRRKFKVRLELLPLDKYLVERHGYEYIDGAEKKSDSERVVLFYQAEWIDQNVSAATIDMPFAIEFLLEGAHRKEIAGPQYFTVAEHVDDSDLATPHFSANGLEEFRKKGLIAEETPQRMRVFYQDTGVPSKEQRLVKLGYINIHDSEDEHVIQCIPPCITAELSIKCADSLALTVSSIHPEDEVEVSTQDGLARNERTWKLPSALLPSQGFIVSWRMK